MTKWKGWNEQEVCSSAFETQAALVALPSAGFTPINAKPAISNPGRSFHGDAVLPSDVIHGKRQHTNSIASEYLGRGEQHDQPGADGLNCAKVLGSTKKKASNNGQKRANTAKPKASTKRRRATEVSDNMAVMKPADPSTSATKSSKSKAVDDTLSKTRLPNQTGGVLNGPSIDESILAHSVSIYSPSTSMDSLKGTQTSLDAVRSSKEHGTTIYQGNRIPNVGRTEVEILQPSESHHFQTNPDTDSGAYKLSLRPRREKPAQNPGNDQSMTSLREAVELDEEDFMNDDNDFAKLAELTEAFPGSDTYQTTGTRSFAEDGPQLPTPMHSDGLGEPESCHLETFHGSSAANSTHEDELVGLFDDEEETAEIANLGSIAADARERSRNMREVDRYEDYGGALLTDSERQLLDGLTTSIDPEHQPITRKPFPDPIHDRSPLFGATNTTRLRTCFRIGEALNEGAQAVRCNRNIILELYARVTSSHREPAPGRKQHFVFKDLYHDRPPYLEGTFELWSQSRLWDLDSKAFLVSREDGIMCRVIAKMKREGMKWRLEILSIWEAGWDDVDFVAGIYT